MLHLKSNRRVRSRQRCVALSLLANLILGTVFVGVTGEIFNAKPMQAQIIPDNTLGNERSHLTPQDVIEGGATRGANLFHSFSEFNIGEGQQVYFANPNGIQRILSRVTGNNRSQILGTLGVLGNADLFFINPNGIVFGANARLDVRGSFVASTADSILFDNGFGFSATSPQVPPLLTIRVPIGLQYGNNAAPIEVQGASLEVSPGQNLALIGGDVRLQNGAVLLVTDGRIELGGLSSLGTVGLEATNNGFELQFPEGVERSHVSMTGRAIVQATSDNGGSVAVNAKTFQILEGSQLLIYTTGDQNATRETSINATDSIAIAGKNSSISSIVDSNGNGASLSLQTRTLTLTDGGDVSTLTFGRGKGGDIAIAASESVTLVGGGISNPDVFTQLGSQSVDRGYGGNVAITTPTFTLDRGAQLGSVAAGAGRGGNVSVTATDIAIQNRGFLASVVGPDASGAGGNLNITTRSLRVTNGGQLGTNTDGPGAGGTLTIQATEAIVFDAAGAAREGVLTGASSRSGFNSLNPDLQVGNGGNIEITTPSFLIANLAGIDASAFKNGQGGNVTVNVQNLSVLNGGQIGAGTIGSGNAGNITIAAANAVTFNGRFDGSRTGRPSAVFTDSQGTGVGGDIRIRANSLTLDNQAEISAQTFSTTGGNITLDVSNLLLLRRGSTVSSTAGRAEAGGDGGNIAIATNFLVAFPTEDSNIAADAFTGRGGNIDITTQGIFGIEFRDRQTPLSDITASSQFGINGVVTINTPDIDPTQGTVELPTTFSTPSLARGCQTRGNNISSFVNTGRGGVPTNPTDPLIADTLWQDLELLGETKEGTREQPTNNNRQLRTENPTSPIIEAQGWVVLSNGTIVLTAQPFRVTPYGIESQGRLFCY